MGSYCGRYYFGDKMKTSTPKAKPSMAILLATYNGAENLQEQLDSYCTQTHVPALILISDDGSIDSTLEIVEKFSRTNPQLYVKILKGPGRGAARNFLYLLGHVPDAIDMIALSDQDDVWLPEKLMRGAAALSKQDGVALYCSRTLEWHAKQNRKRPSRLLVRPPSFCHAIVQNIAGGNTMILNRKAIDLVQAASLETKKIVMHDWWIYQIITGAEGRVIYDQEPMMLYRQHAGNLIGANRGMLSKAKRLRLMMSGRFRRWGTINIRALQASRLRMSSQNAQHLEAFSKGRNGSALERIRMIRKCGFYRQGIIGQMSLYLAALLRRL